MKMTLILTASLALLSLTTLPMPARAASAHNSQRGSLGNSSDPAGPTLDSPRHRRIKHLRKHM